MEIRKKSTRRLKAVHADALELVAAIERLTALASGVEPTSRSALYDALERTRYSMHAVKRSITELEQRPRVFKRLPWLPPVGEPPAGDKSIDWREAMYDDPPPPRMVNEDD